MGVGKYNVYRIINIIINFLRLINNGLLVLKIDRPLGSPDRRMLCIIWRPRQGMPPENLPPSSPHPPGPEARAVQADATAVVLEASVAALTRAVRETFGTGGPSPDLSAAEVREGWRKVAKAVPTRTSQQIRDRWRLGKDHV